MTPSEYVLRYHQVWTPVFQEAAHESGMYGLGGVLTPVLQYCNNNYTNRAGKSPSQRIAFKDDLLRFFRARRKETGSGVYYTKSEGYSILNSIYPVHGCPKSHFMAAVCGKASPGALQSIAQFLSYYRGHRMIKEKADVPTVASLVDTYMGADCNGFVGNYLREKYPGSPVGPSTPEHIFKSKGIERESPADFRTDDVIVFDGFHHVAIIDQIANWTADYAICQVCESRSRDGGGPQFNWYRIEVKTDKKGKRIPWKYKIDGRTDIDCVVKIKGI